MNQTLKDITTIEEYLKDIGFLQLTYSYKFNYLKNFSAFEFNSFLWQIKRSKLKLKFQIAKNYLPTKKIKYTHYLRRAGIIIITIGSFYFAPGMVLKTLAVEKILNRSTSNHWLQEKIFDQVFEKDTKGKRCWHLSRNGIILVGAISSTVVLTILGMYMGGGMKRSFFTNHIQPSLPIEVPILELPAPRIEFWPLLEQNIGTELTYRSRMLDSILKSFGRRKKLQNLLNGQLTINEENIFDVICLLTKLMSHTLSIRGYVQHLLKGHIDKVPSEFLVKLALKEEMYATILGTCVQNNAKELGFVAKYLAELIPFEEDNQLNYNSYRISGESYRHIIQHLFKEYMRKNS